MDELIPIVGMILIFGPIATWAVSITPIGRALADRLRAGRGPDDRVLDLQDEIERLHDHIAGQDQRIEELHDRIDFTERLLTRKSTSEDHSRDVPTPV